ncbi:siderophore-interacting protein [Streptomyces sp. MI02-7b]|uniref:siderophore-interacting protein n=1 Tax=Streptomyces sp. MI02-7b TaxID=462941 RepID=UPI0029A09DEF|nr:siderophore-interacting protein [Streptomyces sp. MI02-7b]MDX3076769.1 siderophore-interacting protein [Streptomyces sp. MI02-7b]
MNAPSTQRVALRDRLLDRFLLHGTVVSVERVAARMRRLRIEGPGLGGTACRPGQQVRVHVDGLTRRTYSVWHHDPAGAIELCVMEHPEPGPGARWGAAAEVGTRVRLGRPEGSFVLRPEARHHVFVGEETAMPALGAMLAALPGDASVHGCVETATAEDRLPLAHADRLAWRLRGGTSAAASEGLAEAVRALDLPEDPAGGAAYVAGEARTVQLVRGVLVRERGWDRRAVLTKPFWSPGKRGME